ncbi:MAG: hypothetical protein AAF682_12030 [Planctomycetota bacterium]
MAAALLVLFLVAQVVLALAVGASIAVRLRERRILGVVVAQELAGPGPRVLGALVILAGLGAAIAARGEIGLGYSLPPLGLALMFVALRPGTADRVCGRDGVRRGWYVRALEELDEWRITGDHLRFRVRGQWEAVPLAAAEQASFETRLRDAIPDRESPFR